MKSRTLNRIISISTFFVFVSIACVKAMLSGYPDSYNCVLMIQKFFPIPMILMHAYFADQQKSCLNYFFISFYFFALLVLMFVLPIPSGGWR